MTLAAFVLTGGNKSFGRDVDSHSCSCLQETASAHLNE